MSPELSRLIESARTVSMTDEEKQLQRLSFASSNTQTHQALNLETVRMETVRLETVRMETVRLETVRMETVQCVEELQPC